MKMCCFFAAYQNGNAWNLFRLVRFDHHRGGVVVSFLNVVSEDIEMFGLYDGI